MFVGCGGLLVGVRDVGGFGSLVVVAGLSAQVGLWFW